MPYAVPPWFTRLPQENAPSFGGYRRRPAEAERACPRVLRGHVPQPSRRRLSPAAALFGRALPGTLPFLACASYLTVFLPDCQEKKTICRKKRPAGASFCDALTYAAGVSSTGVSSAGVSSAGVSVRFSTASSAAFSNSFRITSPTPSSVATLSSRPSRLAQK